MQPSVELEDGYEAGKDAAIKVELEVLPDVPAPAIDGLKLERLTAEIKDEQIDEAVERIASQQKRYEAAPEGHEAKDGDQVVMDRSEEHTSELQSLMRISYAVFCLKKKNYIHKITNLTAYSY